MSNIPSDNGKKKMSRIEKRNKTFIAIIAVIMAILMIVPMISMIFQYL